MVGYGTQEKKHLFKCCAVIQFYLGKNIINMTLSSPCRLAFSWLHQYVLHYPRKIGSGQIRRDVSAAVALWLY